MQEIYLQEEIRKQNLAYNLRYLRLTRKPKLTQAQLAVKLEITQKSLSNYELGNRLPPMHIIAAIAEFYGLTIDELLSNQKGQKSNENLTY